MNSAIRPPSMNQVNDVAMYMTPRTLGSVVRMYARNFDPRPGRATGYGRVATGRGATAVTGCLQRVGTTVTPGSRRDGLSLIRPGPDHPPRVARFLSGSPFAGRLSRRPTSTAGCVAGHAARVGGRGHHPGRRVEP